MLLYYGLAIFEAALVFWTTQSLEFMNSITRGGLAAAQYPIAIYKKWLRNFFTYIVPLAFVNYYPALFILERTDELGRFAALLYFSPLFSFLSPLSTSVEFWREALSFDRQLICKFLQCLRNRR